MMHDVSLDRICTTSSMANVCRDISIEKELDGYWVAVGQQ